MLCDALRRVAGNLLARSRSGLLLGLALCVGCAADRNWDAGPVRRLTYNSTGDRTSSWSPDGARIAYQSWVDGVAQVCIVDIDAPSSSHVQRTGIRGIRPSWSPDGHSVAFQAWLAGRWAICVQGINGDGFEALEGSAGWDRAPSWSPDGSLIAFTSTASGADGVYIMTRAGADVRRLTHDDLSEGHPAWSPDGSHLVFHRGRGVTFELRVIDMNGGARTVWVGSAAGPAAYASWSPDGAWIVYMCSVDGHAEICAVNANGGTTVQLTRNRWSDWFPSWSPDGRWIAFTSDRDQPDGPHGANTEIYLMDVSEVFADVVAAMDRRAATGRRK